MKKLKLNLKDGGEILTREQLKQVFGGSGDGCASYSCHCTRHAGAWTGTYCSSSELSQALNRYCEAGAGQCSAMV